MFIPTRQLFCLSLLQQIMTLDVSLKQTKKSKLELKKVFIFTYFQKLAQELHRYISLQKFEKYSNYFK